MNILEFDINELVSKQVTDELDGLRDSLSDANTKIFAQEVEIDELKKIIKDADIFSDILASMREAYLRIEASKPDDGGWFDSKDKKQFEFFVNLMNNMFGVRKTQEWISSRNYGKLKVYLAVNYYNNKNDITNLVDILSPHHNAISSFIKSFVMPHDYQKEDVLLYVKKPHYCTNGAIFGVSSFWLDSGAGKENLPHDLIMKNPHILEPDVFNILLNTIREHAENYIYLFALPRYNDNISDEQIAELGECLVGMDKRNFNSDVIKYFITENMDKFNTKTLDFLFGMVTKDNHFRILHWENFPDKYQMKFILSMGIDEALKALTNYSCKLSPQDKLSLLKNYAKAKDKNDA